jgi:hypothetical protein
VRQSGLRGGRHGRRSEAEEGCSHPRRWRAKDAGQGQAQTQDRLTYCIYAQSHVCYCIGDCQAYHASCPALQWERQI